MKDNVKMSRVNGMLEKAFRMLNHDFFEDKLEVPVITVIPTKREYAHVSTCAFYDVRGEGKKELNISSAYLDRPLEDIMASLVHEMVHIYDDEVLNEQDTSRNGAYHNKVFKKSAEAHGLIIEKDPTYGWTITSPGEELIDWVIEHDELKEIELCRKFAEDNVTIVVGKNPNGGRPRKNPDGTKVPNNHSIKYVCPCCGNSVRATKKVRIACLDCNEEMLAEE